MIGMGHPSLLGEFGGEVIGMERAGGGGIDFQAPICSGTDEKGMRNESSSPWVSGWLACSSHPEREWIQFTAAETLFSRQAVRNVVGRRRYLIGARFADVQVISAKADEISNRLRLDGRRTSPQVLQELTEVQAVAAPLYKSQHPRGPARAGARERHPCPAARPLWGGPAAQHDAGKIRTLDRPRRAHQACLVCLSALRAAAPSRANS